jgi:hypothetical protein
MPYINNCSGPLFQSSADKFMTVKSLSPDGKKYFILYRCAGINGDVISAMF